VIAVATFYKGVTGFESLSYLFWYLSDLIAATRMRLSTTAVAARMPPPHIELARSRRAQTEPMNGRYEN
jgi:hypothetical protein